ncbi:MAG: DUF1801 domain-containing protein [Flavobacteriales bacterium]|nr:DUF1801 domain-containing protein [Flavobacteriales bacterium]
MSAAVEAWFEQLPEEWRPQAQRLRELLLEASPLMRESWKYSTPFYDHRRWMCYLSLQRKGLVLGFIQGVHMPDPDGLFAPTDHVQIRHYMPGPAPAHLPEGALRRLIQEAITVNDVITQEKRGKARKRKG